MNGPECARCGHDHADVHLTASGVEFGVPIIDGILTLSPAVIEEPEAIQIEAICTECGHARYVPQNQWEWA